MNFFESQDNAKRNTGRLIVLFVLAVLSLIIVTNVLVMFVLGFAGTQMTSMAATNSLQFDWGVFLSIGAAVTGVVLLGSLYKISTLSGGGARVAEMMDGKLLVSGSQDIHERRILNVVEEMAIASGTPVPPVYLMEEAGINAFAAGYSPSDAVIGITRGAITSLSREQLQGVIAHEFSHILHGDMRINIRLIGVLHGIMILGLIGYHLLRGGVYTRRSKESGGIMFVGLALVIVGFVGTFFGNLIKAAVSRQREFLADASAVQFTRNPEGIGGALMQIGRHSERSYLNNPKSAEISHSLFEEGQHSALSGLYATHPPLEKRIAAILPNWDGSYDLLESAASSGRGESQTGEDQSASAAQADQRSPQERMTGILTATTGVLAANAMLDEIGNPDNKHLDYADSILRSIPDVLLEAAREPSGARAVIYFMLLQTNDEVRASQLEFLEDCADQGVYEELSGLLQQTEKIEPSMRLPLTEIAVSSLRQLSANQYQLFKDNFQAVIALDKKVNLFEWSLQKIVFHHLESVFDKKRPARLGKVDLKDNAQAIAILLSILAHSNDHEGVSEEEVFAIGAAKIDLPIKLVQVAEISFERLNEALDELNKLKPLQKPALLKACVACITADQQVKPIEAELMRAIAATIDCPMPPLIIAE